MPNGKPGDHPRTDIVVHGLAVFDPRVDALIADLDRRAVWSSPIASEWLYDQWWKYRETEQHGGENDTRRFLDHLHRVLSEEEQHLDSDG